nr:PREDICTED: RNA-binding protein 44-like isoform X3 [Paralichthys olivaceus]
MLPSNVRKNFTREPHEVTCHSKPLVHAAYDSPITQSAPLTRLNEDGPLWQMPSCGAVCTDPAVLASFSLDMELERSGQRGNPELKSHISVMQDQNANIDANCAEVRQLQSNINKSPSEHCSSDSEDVDGGERSDRSVQSVASEQVSCSLGPAEETGTQEACLDNTDEANLSFDDQNYDSPSIIEEDMSILVFVAPEEPQAQVATDGEAMSDTSETVTSPAKEDTSENCTSPLHRVLTCDVMVGTEFVPRVSTFVQSEDPQTADKHVITEVHMADLDYLAEEFIKLNAAQKEQKEKIRSLGCKLRKGCDCVARAQQAELRLLAVQLLMCRQHCWRLYCTSAEGDQLTTTVRDKDQYLPKEPPANISGVLQKLECDYNHMRDKILEGVPLEQLKPLCVDSKKIITGASYIPAHSILTHDRQTQEKKEQNSKTRRAVTCVPRSGGADHDANKLEEKQIRAACKELNMSESWFDAEEDLEPTGAADTGQDNTTIPEGQTDATECPCEEAESSVLCVANLPRHVTESEVMSWFQKYHPSDVIISDVKNDLRVAIVTVTGLQPAEAAARELNGFRVKGHTLHVERISRAVGGSQGQSRASQEATELQPPETDLRSTERKVRDLK